MLLKINKISFILKSNKKVLLIYKNGTIDYPNEIDSTKELLAYENKCNLKDIVVQYN